MDQFIRKNAPNVDRIVVDPDVNNAKAIHIHKCGGFEKIMAVEFNQKKWDLWGLIYARLRMLLINEFNKYIMRWGLILDGEPLVTPSSKLLPVRYKKMPAMLKIARTAEEQNGGDLMLWWNGQGAASILAHDQNALLMERAMGENSLVKMVGRHQDDEASRIICSVATKLHAPKNKPLPPTLVPLSSWFRALQPAAFRHGGVLKQAAMTARELLKAPQDIVVLHGDLHHDNVLDFGVHGWLAIDPKGLRGERGFDFANIFCNPNIEVATRPGRLERQAALVAEAVGFDRTRLVRWILAYAGLSAAWHLEDGSSPALALAVAEIAAALLR